MSDVTRFRAAFGGTVNDVVMALMSGAYRALLADLGVDPDQEAVRVLVPVSLRSPGDLPPNNQISALLVTLPLAGTTAARYADIRAHLEAVKDLGERVHLVAAAVQQTLTELNTLADHREPDGR